MECYKTKTGSNIYYYEGRRISKEKAKLLYGKKLPKCVSKTNKNIINSLKKQLKEVLSHRENIKGINAELDSKLSACSIIKGEYNNLIELINSSKNTVDVMDRVCLTQDLKKEMDSEYRELKDSLEVKSKNFENIKDLYERTVESVKDLTEKLREKEGETKEIEKSLNEERKIKNSVSDKLEKLTEECSDRPDLIKKVEILSVEISKMNKVNDELKLKLLDSQDMYNNLSNSTYELQGKLERLEELLDTERNRTEQAYKVIETNKVDIDRYEVEIISLSDENNMLRESVDILQGNISSLESEYNNLGNTMATLRQETNELYKKNLELEDGKIDMIERITSLDKALSDAISKYTDDMNDAEEEITRLKEEIDELKYKDEKCDKDKEKSRELISQFTDRLQLMKIELSKEKDECLMRVQDAINNEKEMSSREAKEYRKEISDLNYKLLMTEEALEELRKAEIEPNTQEKRIKKAIKKMKKASS